MPRVNNKQSQEWAGGQNYPYTRSATFKVAASNASLASKNQADWRCTGTADDVDIQAAIDALPAAGGTVVLSEGTFNITATITPRNDLTLLGTGLGATQLLSGMNSLKFFEWDEVSHALLERVCFSDFTMDGDNLTEQCAIDFRGAHGCTFPRLRVINMPDQPVTAVIGAVTLREYTTSPEAGSSRNHFGSLYMENVERGLLFRGFSNDYLCEENVVDAIFIDNATEFGVSLNYTKHTRIGYCSVRLGANSAVGFYFNLDNILTSGVEGNSVGHLFVDSTGYTTCVGVHFGASRKNVIGMLTHLPDVFNGDLVEPYLSDSYRIVAAQPDGAGRQDMTHFELRADGGLIADPGDGNAIPITMSGHVPLVTAGAETRTLGAPTSPGQELILYCKTFVGNCVVTCATTVNEAGNNTITFTATGQACLLYAVEEGSNRRWRLASVDGAGLSTV